MAAERELGEHERAVNGDFKGATRRLDELHRAFGEGLADLGFQTGSPGLVVSSTAVLNRYFHDIDVTDEETGMDGTGRYRGSGVSSAGVAPAPLLIDWTVNEANSLQNLQICRAATRFATVQVLLAEVAP